MIILDGVVFAGMILLAFTIGAALVVGVQEFLP